MLSHPILQSDVIREAIPGNIRKAEHFLPLLKKLIIYFRDLMKSKELLIMSPLKVLFQLQEKHFIEQRTLKFTQQRLQILFNTLQIESIDDYRPLTILANLVTLISTYFKGFTVIMEPYSQEELILDPVL
jgi:DNA excision repair protein ERCC-2